MESEQVIILITASPSFPPPLCLCGNRTAPGQFLPSSGRHGVTSGLVGQTIRKWGHFPREEERVYHLGQDPRVGTKVAELLHCLLSPECLEGMTTAEWLKQPCDLNSSLIHSFASISQCREGGHRGERWHILFSWHFYSEWPAGSNPLSFHELCITGAFCLPNGFCWIRLLEKLTKKIKYFN
jgi:hypothetical protein